MSLLDGGIRSVFGSVFGSIYLDATLIRVTQTSNGKGGWTETTADHDCKAHAPGRSEAYLVAAGFADGEIEIIVLAAGLPIEPGTDDRLTYRGEVYDISAVRGDGAHSHWRLRARRRNNGAG